MHGAIILSDVEIDGPRPQCGGQRGIGGLEVSGGISFVEQGMFGGVAAEQVEVGMSQVCLKADCFRHTDFFQRVEHGFP